MGHTRKFSPHTRARRFTPEQDTDVARLYTERRTLKAIAVQYGVSESAVRNSLLRTGVTLRPRNSPRPDDEWATCICGNRAIFSNGSCRRCYDKARNGGPAMREYKFGWWLMKHHGLARDAYDAMLAAQNGVCAVCQQPDPRGAKLAVDHDHACCPADASCGKCRRGLLCVNCNRAIGLLGDSADNAARLLNYLTNDVTV